MTTTTTTTDVIVEIGSITSALVSAGGILALSVIDIPLLQSQPASRSLPSIRWIFSRGSHIFPQAAELSTAGFLYLAYIKLPSDGRSISQLVNFSLNSNKVNANILAAALLLGIVPFTSFVMIPTNFALIKFNEEKGGFRSARSAEENVTSQTPGTRSADDSVMSKGESSEFADFSGPQSSTTEVSTAQEDKRARELLGKFALLNYVRAGLVVAGGMVGLFAALI